MLGSEYIEIDQYKYTPTDFSYAIIPDETVFKSAAGTDLLNIKRLDKHEFTLSWEGIDSDLIDQIEIICERPTVLLTYRRNTYTCRARGIAPDLLRKSYKYRRSDGLWNASIKLTEL